MKDFKNKKGFKVIKIKTVELMEVIKGSLGICDSCNSGTLEGYYIPVLSRFYCEKCYKEWEEKAVYYEEDKWFESANHKQFLDQAKNAKVEVA